MQCSRHTLWRSACHLRPWLAFHNTVVAGTLMLGLYVLSGVLDEPRVVQVGTTFRIGMD